MATKDWQAAAEAYAARSLELYPGLDPSTQTAMYRVVVEAFKMGAIAGLDRAGEIAREETVK